MPTGKEWEDIEETSKDMLDIYIYMWNMYFSQDVVQANFGESYSYLTSEKGRGENRKETKDILRFDGSQEIFQ